VPSHVDRPSEATSLRALAVRVFNLERTLKSKQTDALIGREVAILFGLSTLGLGVSSPFPPPWRLQLTNMFARLRLASTSGPVTARLWVDDGGPTDISVPAGQKTAEQSLSQQIGPADWLTMQSLALGVGAAGLTVRVDGFVIGRS
jgi:hypothetical protein